MKRHAPAALRNREPIAEVLRAELPTRGAVLEIASGTGEHAIYFASLFPELAWQPSDPDPDARDSIAAWRSEAQTNGSAANLRPPILFDVCGEDWPAERIDAILCINMIHISPPEAAEALFAGAGRLLDRGAPLILYGPFVEEGTPTAPSNLAFDASLRARDPRWGLRAVDWIDQLAAKCGLVRTRRVEMPANNLMLVYRRRG